MGPVQTWGEAITVSLIDLWERFANFLPSLVGALLVFFLGLIVAVALGKMAEKIIDLIRIDQAISRMKLGDRFKDTGIQIKVSKFFGGLVKWFLILVFLMASTDILHLTQVSQFLNSVIFYIPNVVIATIILSVAFLVGNFVYHAVRSSTKIAGVVSASFLAAVAKWAIMIFGLLAALVQLGIAVSLVNTIFIGLVAALSLAFGLAFGLGGKEEAGMILKKVRENLEK
jgi:purine-cytosine permease-like protein